MRGPPYRGRGRPGAPARRPVRGAVPKRTTERNGPGRMLVGTLLLATMLSLSACGGEQEFEPPDREARVEEAESLYSAALFDTVAWESDEVRSLEGNAVFAARCRQCHGPLGRGETDYAAERNLDMPSLVEPEWAYAGDLDAARRRIFTGHPEGMPTWGVAGISPREIDAVAFYILEVLRPEVLGGR